WGAWTGDQLPLLTDGAIPDGASHIHGLNLSLSDFAHKHGVSVPAHTHNFDVPNHSHSLTINNHTHNVSIPDHTHAIEFGIFKLEELPTNVTISVDGNAVDFTGTSADNLDLIPYLSKDSDGKVTRGKHVVTIT